MGVWLVSGSATAQTVTINFDTRPSGASVPTGSPVTAQYRQAGVARFDSPGGSPTAENHPTAASAPHVLQSRPCCDARISWVFINPVSNVSVTAIEVGDGGLTLECFDPDGASVGTASVTNSGSGAGLRNVLTITAGLIDRCQTTQISATGDQYWLDNLTFTLGSVCGNGVVEMFETCDTGTANSTPGSCCTDLCEYRPAGQTCRPSAGGCDAAEVCNGTTATCPVVLYRPSAMCTAAAS